MNITVQALTTTVSMSCDVDRIGHELDAMFSTLPGGSGEPLLRYVIARDGQEFTLERDDVVVYRDRDALAMPPALELDLYRQVPRMTTGAWVLHAAGVALGQDTFVLVGASGSGKTTACHQLIESGWSYLTEEICAIDTRGRVTGLRRPLHLRSGEEPSAVHPQLWSPPGAQLVEGGDLSALLALEFRPDRPWQLSPMVPSEALTAMWEQTFDTRPGPMRTASGLVARFPCYRLQVGAPDHPAAALSELRNLVR